MRMQPIRPSDDVVAFGPYQIDQRRGVLLRDGAVVPLRPKAWEVLLLLVAHPHELLSTDAILDSVWTDVAVSPKTLTNIIGELRLALGDNTDKPRYIQTVHRRGYRFVATESTSPAPATETVAPVASSAPASASLIGRTAELATLRASWSAALAGHRQIVFVGGEPGVGKSRLVNELIAEVRNTAHALPQAPMTFAGQCFERHGAHEAYMPLLDAIAEAAAGDGSQRIAQELARFAPTWLEQLPWMQPEGAATQPNSLPGPLGAARMLREGLQFFDSLATNHPVLLVLEDLHWADAETVDFVAALARRSRTLPLFFVGTYRLAEARIIEHPLVRVADDACRAGATRVLLENFSPPEIEAYLQQQLGDGRPTPSLVRVVEEHSGGNPLFVQAIAAELRETGRLVRTEGEWRLDQDGVGTGLDLPDTVRGAISAQVDLLPEENRRVLAAAAVAGEAFDAALVAAGLAAAADDVEARLDACAKAARIIVHDSVGRSAQAPGTRARFRFAHVLYQRVLYEHMPPPKRRHIHQRLAEFLECHRGSEVPAALLADHFERSGDHSRAAIQLERCADAAARRSADRERLAYLERAERHIREIPRNEACDALELRVTIGIAESAAIVRGPHDERVHEAAARARARFATVHDGRSLYIAMHALWMYSLLNGEYHGNGPVTERAKELRHSTEPELQMLAELVLGANACFHGFPQSARSHLEAAEAHLARLDGARLPPAVPDVRVEIPSVLAWAQWLTGEPDRALATANRALDGAIERSDSVSAILASIFLYNIHFLRGEYDAAALTARELSLVGEEFEIALATLSGTLLQAAVHVEKLDLDAAFSMIAATGPDDAHPGLHQIVRTYFITRMAQACGRLGRAQEGLLLLSEADARTRRSGSPISESEIWRVRGDLAAQLDGASLATLGLVPNPDAAPLDFAETCLQRAEATARQQGARSLELRAMTSLARLQHATGRSATAYEGLSRLYATFTEGFTTADLGAAKELLDEIRAHALQADGKTIP